MARQQVKPDNLSEMLSINMPPMHHGPAKEVQRGRTGCSVQAMLRSSYDPGLNKELDRVNEMETLFAQFKASVDLDEKESLAAFLKLMEGPRDVEPKEFRQMGR
ncbi:hypothetical protein EG327_005000 [Venturia inaequalis]|uniref:Uncharacterized protein n=1 Tax=Venturia inaequalis TaxID=5025 RepID=A0A8H3VBF8_VENIN|nr:hypothetical protein EG327_005000 [Venturia inaequalis]